MQKAESCIYPPYLTVLMLQFWDWQWIPAWKRHYVGGHLTTHAARACRHGWKRNSFMGGMIQGKWLWRKWRPSSLDISSAIGTTGEYASLMRGFLLWSNDRDTMNLWILLPRHWYPCKKVSTNIGNIRHHHSCNGTGINLIRFRLSKVKTFL